MGPVADTGWPARARGAACCAALLFAVLIALDAGTLGLTGPRTLLWAALAVVLLAILLPPHVTAGDGWLASRGLLRRRRVLTGRLVAVHWGGAFAQRLVLRDAAGNRLELDLQVLAANPALWHRLDTALRHSRTHGTLRIGSADLEQLTRALDAVTAHAVLRVSGLAGFRGGPRPRRRRG
ncbi:hypothetical protein [Streptomyces mobaraensis]|uniref:Uncharacterized protein n=1 Tax=Streptomyces mobaraensis (strain ATCC 29032 / DSM 40847 / JCM 4168 / NBRC 13819 / NCIMB 11159 / IPCR 16-22) TaxID=1223523 RepID=M3B7M1_STRM1|nr:hypothetical protein [Streptomyces mobaraensis]EMF02003.1 hypothetical protein H340_03239 [Streptomyces mobaraensis NBRC 13819 = DSM 40847]